MKSQNLGSQERSEAAPESEEPEKMDVDTVEAVEADGVQNGLKKTMFPEGNCWH